MPDQAIPWRWGPYFARGPTLRPAPARVRPHLTSVTGEPWRIRTGPVPGRRLHGLPPVALTPHPARRARGAPSLAPRARRDLPMSRKKKLVFVSLGLGAAALLV